MTDTMINLPGVIAKSDDADFLRELIQVDGAAADGHALFRKKLSRQQFAKFMTSLPPCVVAMKACGTAHYWGRELSRLGHEVRLIPPVYVKPFVERQKNDAADAEAVAEAAQRPSMRTVTVKTAAQQARAMLFRTRDLLVGQRTQLVNALRGHLAEHGVILGKGIGYVGRIADRLEEDDLPELVQHMGRLYLDQIAQVGAEIGRLDDRIAAEAKESDVARRLQKMPGIGPVCAMAITTFAPKCASSGGDATTLLGSASSSGSILPVVSRSLVAPQRWARHPKTADHRRHVRRAVAWPQGRPARIMALQHARP